MAKRQGGRRRLSRSHTWIPLVAAILGLLTTAGLGRLVSVARAWLAAGRASVCPAAAVASQYGLQAAPARGPGRVEDQP
jgi:cell division protein FtsW (lipid II flippase)